jgi:transcription elongation factor Elf1
MTNTNELLPCPFCGAKAIWKDGIPKNSPVGYVKCSNETCGFYIDTEHKVWKNPSCWNTRAESQQSESLKAENEELKFRIEELEQQNGFECGCVVSRDEENNRLRKALDDIAN